MNFLEFLNINSKPVEEKLFSKMKGGIGRFFSLPKTIILSLLVLCSAGNIFAQGDCVVGVSITPSTQTICRNTVPTNIEVTISIAAGAGGASNITYEWYSSTTNSTSGGTLVKTTNTTTATTFDTYTPPTNSSGSRYYYCVVTNSEGSCAGTNYTTSTSRVTVNTPPSANIAANPGLSICENTNVTFTASGTGLGTTPSYQWKLNGASVGTNSNTFTSSSLVQGDIVRVEITASTSCTTPAAKQVTMTVNEALTPTVSITASNDDICVGDAVAFTASPVNGGASPVYQWKVNGVNAGTNSSTFNTTSLSNGDIVTVDLTSNAVCATPTTVSSNAIPITVHALLPVSVSIAASDNNICAGTSVTFTATPINGGNSPVYQWKLNGSDVGSNSPTYTSTTLSNNDIVSVIITSNATPCATGNPAASNQVQMIVNPVLPVGVSITRSVNNICPGTSVTFTATPTNGGSSPSYQWKLNGVDVGTNSPTYTTSSLVNGDAVKVVMTSNAAPCAAGSPKTSNTLTTTVNPNLPVSVSIAASASTICTGSSVTFTATPVNPGSAPVYQWTVNGSNVGTNSATFTTSTLSNNDVVAVTLNSNATPCATGNPASSNNITMTVNPRPTPTFTTSPASGICVGSSSTYTTQPGQSNYVWSLPGTSGIDYLITSGSTGSSSNTVTVNWLTAGSKTVTVNYNNSNGCNGNSAASSTIIVNANLVPSVTVSASTTSVCSNGSATFTATPTNGGTSPTYQWKLNGVNISGATGATYTKSSWSTSSSSTISVTMTSNYACAVPTTATSTGILMNVYSSAPANIAANSIVGPTSICPPATVVYTVTPVARAESYIWQLPPGFNIISGNGTNTITVSVASSASVGNNQNVTVYATNPCGDGQSKTLKVNVNNFAGVDAGPDASVCAGSTITLSGVWSGNTSSSAWSAPSGSFSNAASPTSGYTPSITSGSVVLTITTNDPSGACDAATDNVVITVNQPPAITSQPSGQTTCSGSNVSFSVSATGSGLTYQWRKGTTLLTDGSGISGATTSTLTLSNVASGTAGSYNVIVSGAAPCSSVTSSSATLVVNTAISITSQPAVSQNACVGKSISFSVSASGTGRTYQWRKGTTPLTDGGSISGANTATLTINPVAAADAASDYNVVVSGTAPCSPVTSNNAALTVYDPVVVIDDPISQTVCSGSPVTFTVNATGSGLTYQWRRNGSNLTDNSNIVGSNTSTLTINPATTSLGGTYTVYITGVSPCSPVLSGSANLIVNQAVSITTQPVSSKTVCSGSSTTLSVVATGTGLTYQWRKGTTNLVDNGNISGTNTATLTFNPALSGDAAADYNVVVSGTAPCSPVISSNSTLNVNEAVNITTQPASQTVCTGSTITLTVGATGDGLTYQWKRNGTNISNSASISGATGSTLTISNATTSNSGNYTVVVGGASPCAPVTSSTAVVTVNQAVTITTQPSNISMCGSFAVDFNVVATGTGLTYQWYKNGSPLSNNSNISGVTSNNLHFVQGNLSDNGSYYVVVSGAAPCASVTSATRILDVNESIIINTQPVASQTLCQGLSASFSVTASASDPLDYQWRLNGANIPGANAATYVIPSIGLADGGNYDVVISGPSGYTCPSVNSSISALSVTPTVGTPVFTAGGSAVCQDAADETYTATATNNTGISYSVSPTAAGVINSLTGVMNWDAAFTGTATITANATGCNGPKSASIVVTVKPKPTYTGASSGAICSGTALNYTLSSNLSGASYTWSRTSVSGISNAAVSGQTSNPITETLINTSSSAKSVVYLIIPTVNGCAGDPGTYTVTVRSLPTATISGTSTVCIGASSGVTFTGSNGTAPYTFTYKVNGGSNQTITATSGNSVTVNANTAAAGTSTYTLVSVADANCAQSQSGSAVITVQQSPTISLSSASGTNNQNKCVGNSITNITYTIGGSATGASITAGSLPTGVTGTFSSGVFTISGTPSSSGTFNYTVSTSGPCSSASLSGTITVVPSAVGGTTTSSTNLFACAGTNAGYISLSGQTGTVQKWQSSTNGGQTWTDIANTTTTLNYTNLNQTIWYRAVVAQASCSGVLAYSTHSVVSVVPIANSLSAFASPAVICSGATTLTASGIGSSSTVGQIQGGSFDNAGAPLEGPGLWRAFEGSNPHNIAASANNGVNPFNLTNGPKTFFGSTPGAVTYNNDPLGGQSNNNKFMVANGPVTSTLETPIFSLTGLTAATLDWWEAYILEAGASLKIELSTDAGNTYNNVVRPQVNGPATFASPTNFTHVFLDLAQWAGLSNLRVRFTYTGTTYSSWALEAATITKGTAPATYTWNLYDPAPVAGTPPAHYLNVFTAPSVTVTPPSPNTTNAPIVYHYSLVSSAGGCATGIDVTVNPSPVVTHTTVSAICSGNTLSPNINFNSTISGTTYSYQILNPGGVTGIVTNSNGTVSGTPVNPTSSPQTVTIIASPITAYCPGTPDTVRLVVNPKISVVLSGNSIACPGSPAIITLTSAGPFPFNVTLSNGITYNVTGSPFNISVSPTTNTTYSINSLSPASCASGGGYSGTATVTVPTSTAPIGTWICGVSNDWFNPCNWGQGIVPTNSIDVIIPNTASCSPVIDPTSSYAPLDKIARSRNITIGTLQNVSFNNGGDLYVAGNWINNRGTAGFTANTGTVTFMGSTAQTITTTSGSTEAFYNLRINNSSNLNNAVTLNNPATVSSTLTLVNGIVKTASDKLLTVTNPATAAVVGGAANTYIWGPIARNTNTTGDYYYPVGNPAGPYSVYRPNIVTPQDAGGNLFQGEYKVTLPAADLSNHGGDLTGILTTEHWQIDRTSGASNAIIKLFYINPNNSNHWENNIAPCAKCNVAIVTPFAPSDYWYFTNGFNFGSGFDTNLPETRHNTSSGILYSKVMSAFGDFTFGFANNQILPVKLTAFDGQLQGKNGLLKWSVENSDDLEGFDLEYSQDGRHYSKLATINKVSATNEFQYLHYNLANGTNYYRLLVKDKNGNKLYSRTILLVAGKALTVVKGIVPTVVNDQAFLEVYSASNQVLFGTLLDVTGRSIGQYKMELKQGPNRIPLNTNYLSKGVYLLNLKSEDGTVSNQRFIRE